MTRSEKQSVIKKLKIVRYIQIISFVFIIGYLASFVIWSLFIAPPTSPELPEPRIFVVGLTIFVSLLIVILITLDRLSAYTLYLAKYKNAFIHERDLNRWKLAYESLMQNNVTKTMTICDLLPNTKNTSLLIGMVLEYCRKSDNPILMSKYEEFMDDFFNDE